MLEVLKKLMGHIQTQAPAPAQPKVHAAPALSSVAVDRLSEIMQSGASDKSKEKQGVMRLGAAAQVPDGLVELPQTMPAPLLFEQIQQSHNKIEALKRDDANAILRKMILERLGSLEESEEQESQAEAWQFIARSAATICQTPISACTLLDDTHQHFKGAHGIGMEKMTIEGSFCGQAILSSDDIFIVPDTLKDERFALNPAVIDEPSIRFYAGVPIVVEPNIAVGTVCVLDKRPRKLNPSQLATLQMFAKQAAKILQKHG